MCHNCNCNYGIFIAPLLRDEGTSQNNRQSVTLYPAVHRQTGTKKFSVGDEK